MTGAAPVAECACGASTGTARTVGCSGNVVEVVAVVASFALEGRHGAEAAVLCAEQAGVAVVGVAVDAGCADVGSGAVVAARFAGEAA